MKIRKLLKNSILTKIIKIIFRILLFLLELIIIALALVIVVQRVTNNEKSFLGYRIFNIATGSMEPQLNVGDVIICKEIEPEKIKVGDSIVYLGNEKDYHGKTITHAVIQIENGEDGKLLFHTKGIANTAEDPIVHEEQVYGIVIETNEVLTFLCKLMANRFGLYFVVIVPITIYVFVGFVKSQGRKLEAELKQKEEEEKKRQAEKEKNENNEENEEKTLNIEKEENKSEVSQNDETKNE